MQRAKRCVGLLTVTFCLLVTPAFNTAQAGKVYCDQDCVSKCDPDKPECFVHCCEDACKKAREACEHDAKDLNKVDKRQCYVDKKQAKQDCEKTLYSELNQCDALACLDDPNQDFDQCRSVAKYAKKDCKDLAKGTYEQCKRSMEANQDITKASCDLAEAVCLAACLGVE